MIAILQSYSSMLLGALGKTLLLTLLSLLICHDHRYDLCIDECGTITGY